LFQSPSTYADVVVDAIFNTISLQHNTELRSLHLTFTKLTHTDVFDVVHHILTCISPHRMTHLLIAFPYDNLHALPEDQAAALAQFIGEPQFAALQVIQFELRIVRGGDTLAVAVWLRERFSEHREALRVCFV
jgi:hypothetical protein